MKQAYRPERPTPFETIVALAGMTLVAAIVLFVGWLGLTYLLTVGEQVRQVLP